MGTMAVNQEVIGELVGPLPRGVYLMQSAMSYFGKARKTWKKLERLELGNQYYDQMKMGIVGNFAAEIASDFSTTVSVARTALGMDESTKMLLRGEYLIVSVWNCTEQSKRFHSSLRALKDALSMNRQMPPRLENRLNAVKLATEEGLTKKVIWLFSPSSMEWAAQGLVLIAWRVGQIAETLICVAFDGFKLSMYSMDVMDAYYFSDETKKEIEDREWVYAAILAERVGAILTNGSYMADHAINFLKAKDPSFKLAGAVIDTLRKKAGLGAPMSNSNSIRVV
jgi:hypothetical protein